MSIATATSLELKDLGHSSARGRRRSPEHKVDLSLVPSRPDGWCRRARAEESRRLFRRTLCASIIFHLLGFMAGWLFINSYLMPRDQVISAQPPELFDVSIVPLSALDTVLPRGEAIQQPAEAPPVAKEEPPQKIVEEKPRPPEVIVPKKKLESPKSPKKEQPQQVAQSTTTSTGVAVEHASVTSQPGFVNGTAASLEEARLNYQEAVASLLARAKRYPERALRRGVTGEATIRIEIKSDGSLAEFAILRSAGATVLDEELRAMVDRAAPFPSFPGDLRRSSLALVVPVAFTIK